MKFNRIYVFLLSSFGLFLILACNALAPVSTPMPTAIVVIPSPIPATDTPAPLLSQQVTVLSMPFEESSQSPSFTLKAQIPQLTGSDDPRVAAFDQRLSELVTKEVDMWRKSFQENTYPTIANGSFLEAVYTVVSQKGDIWSFKFDFHFYSDGAAHPGSYSITLNYDLAQGRELVLADLFLPNMDYLGSISNYCVAELSKQPFFEGPFAEGAQPKPENYSRWNIAPDGLMITFDEYQVAPYAAGPQQVLIPYSALQDIINPQGALAGFIQ